MFQSKGYFSWCRTSTDKLFLLWLVISGCSPVNMTASTTDESEKPAVTSGDAAKNALPSSASGDPSLSLPSWCKMNQSSDQVCFHCVRNDGGVDLIYEQCLTPSEKFRASSDCWFSDQVTKSISCVGTRSGEDFVMDVSIAKEKVSATIPVILIALNIAVSEKFGSTSSVTKFVGDISTFLGSRIQQVMRGENLPGVAGDLGMLINKYTTSKLSDQEFEIFKASTSVALTLMVSELSGKKDYDLSRFLLKSVELSKLIPNDKLGDAKPLLSGPGLADLWSSDNNNDALEKAFKILSPAVLGFSSVEKLMARLKQGD